MTHRDVPPGQGTVIAIAEFTNAAGKSAQVAKVGVAATAREGARERGWEHLQGTLTVPPLCANLRLRLGFSYSRGTCWWDDVTVDAVQPLVARIELAQARVVPAMETLPVALLNRAEARGAARLRVRLGTEETLQEVTLTGAPVQRVSVPLHVGRRGRMPLQLVLLQPGQERPLFLEERSVTVPPPLVLLPLIPTHWAVEDGVPSLQGDIELAVTNAERERGSLAARLLDADGRSRATWSSATRRLPVDGVIHFSLRAPGLPMGEYRVVLEFSGVSAEQPWAVIPRRQARVTLNKDGYLEQDGKVVFPLGIFNGGARMEEAAAAGFTVAHAYNAVRVEPGERPDDQRASDFLDAPARQGCACSSSSPSGLRRRAIGRGSGAASACSATIRRCWRGMRRKALPAATCPRRRWRRSAGCSARRLLTIR